MPVNPPGDARESPGAPPAGRQVRLRWSVVAIFGLLLSIAGLFAGPLIMKYDWPPAILLTAIAGLVLSLWGGVETRGRRRAGFWVALSGAVVSALALLIPAVYFLNFLISMQSIPPP